MATEKADQIHEVLTPFVPDIFRVFQDGCARIFKEKYVRASTELSRRTNSSARHDYLMMECETRFAGRTDAFVTPPDKGRHLLNLGPDKLLVRLGKYRPHGCRESLSQYRLLFQDNSLRQPGLFHEAERIQLLYELNATHTAPSRVFVRYEFANRGFDFVLPPAPSLAAPLATRALERDPLTIYRYRVERE